MILKAAPLLRVHTLKYWLGQQYMSGQYHLCLEALRKCAKKYIFEQRFPTSSTETTELESVSQASNIEPQTPLVQSQASPGSYTGFFTAFGDTESAPRRTREVEEEMFDNDLEQELKAFKNTIQRNNGEILKKIKYSSEFWLSADKDNKPIYPILSQLALRLAALPSSSASIERYFSVFGNILKKNANSMGVDLFIARAMIKANIDIVKTLREFEY